MALLNVKMRVNSNPRNTGLELIMNDKIDTEEGMN